MPKIVVDTIVPQGIVEPCPELNYPGMTVQDYEDTFKYFCSKYSDGNFAKPSLAYYVFWGMQDYSYLNEEELKNGIRLYLKEKSHIEDSADQNNQKFDTRIF